MGFFDKLFKKSDSAAVSTDPVKTGQMLDEDLYWSIIAKSLQNNPSQNEQERILVAIIEKLSTTEIIGFRLRTDKLR